MSYDATGWSSVEEFQAYARSRAFVLAFASLALAIAAVPPSWQRVWLLGLYSQPRRPLSRSAAQH